MKKIAFYVLSSIALISCNGKDGITKEEEQPTPTEFMKAADISELPEITAAGTLFYNSSSQEQTVPVMLKNSGVNTIRLRLWVNPADGHCGYNEVRQFAQQLKAQGFRIWLTVHYSDTWADPANQETPAAWQSLGLEALKQQVAEYTQMVVTNIQADVIQIGNETNSGFLYPLGNINSNYSGFTALMESAIQAVRTNAPDTKIMLHYAGIEGADWFFNKADGLDYDIIGLSYYPVWHGTNLNTLKSTLTQLNQTYGKEVVIAETAYPFTLGWNDYTNNIVGLDNQLVNGYPATALGQKDFVNAIEALITEVNGGVGFCYWGGERIAWKGSTATDGSDWENQAFFDFDNTALPVLEAFWD